MKRDMDLVRALLLHVEACENPAGFTSYPQQREPLVEGYSQAAINYHLLRMIEGGLVSGTPSALGQGALIAGICLTWEGHEFLDAARSEARWATMRSAMGAVGGFGAAVVKAVLIDMSKREVQTWLP